MTKEEAKAIYHQGEEAVIAKLLEYDTRLTQLEEMLGLNSKNSSKPPSTDNPFTKDQNKKSSKTDKKGLKRGGQKGHQGKTLEQIENPDKIERYSVCECSHCSCNLTKQEADNIIKRQCFDIPPITMEITEHQAEVKQCPNCKNKTVALFPQDVVAPAYYGDNIKAYVAYLNNLSYALL